MYRRALLAAVCGLSGCTGAVPNPLGGEAGSNGGSGGGDNGGGGGASAGEDGPSTGTDTPSTASSGEPATATETPSAAELRRLSVPDLLDIARAQITAAVTTFIGDGDELTDVTARSGPFDPAPVVTHLFHARRAYEAASRQGISAEQEETIRKLRRLDAAVRLLIDVQVLLTEAHDDLEGVARAIRFVDAETISSLTKRIGSRQQRAAESVAALSRSQYETAVAASTVENLSKTSFVEKRRQLHAETSVLADLNDAFPVVLDGVARFAEAQGARRSGSPYAAARTSREAVTALGRGLTQLRTVSDSVPPRGRALQPITAELVSVTATKRDDARAFADSIEL
jgi:hypothetical protein